jgi:anti-sigma factor RsiW
MSFRDHIPFLRRRVADPMSCRELVDLLTDYLEGALPDDDRARLEAHLSVCEACTMYVEQMREMLDALGTIEPEQVSPAAYEELSGVFAAWKAERTG